MPDMTERTAPRLLLDQVGGRTHQQPILGSVASPDWPRIFTQAPLRETDILRVTVAAAAWPGAPPQHQRPNRRRR